MESYSVYIDIKPDQDISTYYINLTREGKLTIKKGYSWDGPSGPTIDTLNFMRGSLVHDAIYQLIRQGYLGEEHREPADKLLQKMCMEDKMSKLRARLVYLGVRVCGGPAADPENKKQVIRAPKLCRE